MSIRKQLLWLLLGIAVIPLLVITAFYQVSSYFTRRYIATQTRHGIEADAHTSLVQLVENYDETIRREQSLVNSIISSQGREVEVRLAQLDGDHSQRFAKDYFGFDQSIDEAGGINGEPQAGKLEHPGVEVDYRRQDFFLVEGIEQSEVANQMWCLHSMTSVYHELYQFMSGGMLWQYTSLESGLHTTYPAGSQLPQPGFYDPRKRDWYVNAKQAGGAIVRTGPAVDAASDEVIITIAKAVYYPDGRFAGVTAIDRTIPDLFRRMLIPERWARDAQRFLVEIDPADPSQLQVVLKCDYAKRKQSWHRTIELESLTSKDTDAFQSMLKDVDAGNDGIAPMEYQGQMYLWVYGKPVSVSEERSCFPLIVIPRAHVLEMAHQAERYVLGQSVIWLEGSIFFLIMVITVVVVVALWKSRAIVRPIRMLAQAGKDLSKGDYSVKVDIKTGDELEELGCVFNEVGPRLQTVEKLQRSMELAGAIQKNLLPHNAPKMKNLEMSGRCRYCDQTGGDYYDFIELVKIQPGKIGIALGDVSGHGIGAALLMANMRSALRAVSVYCGDEPAKMLKELNLHMAKDSEDDKFMTLFYGIFDENDRSLVWASGGHDPALWYHFEKGTIDELPNTGIPLGILEDQEFDEIGPVYLSTGDLLVIGTDGIWETQNPEGVFFGKERLEQMICGMEGMSADKICSKIIEEVVEFGSPNPPSDDITVVAVKCL